MSSTPVDSARAVRAGEELDLAKLEPLLRERLEGVGAGEAMVVEQFPSGHSNLTYRVRFGEREYVLRRPPFGSKVKSAHDMGREFKVLSRLCEAYPCAPRPIFYCDDEAVIGAKFYVMERIVGVILRKDAPPGLLEPAERARRLCESFVDNLAAIHAIDWAGIGLGDLGKPDGYVERQVSGWTRRYADSQTDEIPEVGQVSAWLAANLPVSGAPTLLHNDYKFDNLVLDAADPTRIIGVLDWEMSTVGDPLMDVGTALSYWIRDDDDDVLRMMRWGPTHLPGMFTRDELVARYAERTGRDVSKIDFYYAFALFKNAVVIQQIYYRYAKGLTKDPRFAQFIHGVRSLARAAWGTVRSC